MRVTTKVTLIAAMTLMALVSLGPRADAQGPPRLTAVTEEPMKVVGTQLVDCKIIKTMTFVQSEGTDHADAGPLNPRSAANTQAMVTVTCERVIAYSVVSDYIESLKRSGSPNR